MQFTLDPQTTFAKLKFEKQNSTKLPRKAKIYTNKLPADFFDKRSPAASQIKVLPKRYQIHTQKHSRKVPAIQRSNSTRGIMLAKGGSASRVLYQPNALDSIASGICSTKQIKRQISRHNSQLRRQGNIMSNPEYGLELPPLKLRKVLSDS